MMLWSPQIYIVFILRCQCLCSCVSSVKRTYKEIVLGWKHWISRCYIATSYLLVDWLTDWLACVEALVFYGTLPQWLQRLWNSLEALRPGEHVCTQPAETVVPSAMGSLSQSAERQTSNAHSSSQGLGTIAGRFHPRWWGRANLLMKKYHPYNSQVKLNTLALSLTLRWAKWKHSRTKQAMKHSRITQAMKALKGKTGYESAPGQNRLCQHSKTKQALKALKGKTGFESNPRQNRLWKRSRTKQAMPALQDKTGFESTPGQNRLWKQSKTQQAMKALQGKTGCEQSKLIAVALVNSPSFKALYRGHKDVRFLCNQFDVANISVRLARKMVCLRHTTKYFQD